jgi:hypothetical protein
VDHLLASGPEAIAQTKACALRSAWSNLDEDVHRADHKSCRQAPDRRSCGGICVVP